MDENSKWIHRDKLAKIESAEMQAAGIVLPKPRSHSRPRRDRSTDKLSGARRATDDSGPRSGKSSAHRATPSMDSEWDSRRTDEKDTSELWITSESLGGPRGGSRIPVPKSSPAPLSADTMVLPDEEPSSAAKVAARKTRSRGSSINALDDATRRQYGQKTNTESPKKVAAPRKTATRSASANPATRTQTNRPKTRSGPNRENSSTTARPRTRDGILSSPTKSAPEGDPPWMINSYKPDPRLPPDQQLLPTVARRLQQEQWEKEGKFGNVYDKDFRPLNEQDHSKSPEPYQPRETPESEEEPRDPAEATEKTEPAETPGQADEWPLRDETQSPTPSKAGAAASYSAMPRIQDNPPVSPMASPRLPSGQQPTPITKQPTQQEEAPMQEKPEEEKKKDAGCGCCVIM